MILAPFFLALVGSYFLLDNQPNTMVDLMAYIGVSGAFACWFGFRDDKYDVPAIMRLLLTIVGSLIVVIAWHAHLHSSDIPDVFNWMVIGLLTLAYAWHINLFNFMDGMDLISVLQTLTIALGVLAISFFAPIEDLMLALALATAGLALGFAPFNWPNAKAFMGDAGSYGFGLLTGALLLYLAGATNIFVPLILSGYYWMDASSTLCYRALKRENIFKAHRQHAYQRALDKGWGKWRVLNVIALSNLGTVGLACLAVSYPLHAATLCLFWVAWIIAVLRNPFEKRV